MGERRWPKYQQDKPQHHQKHRRSFSRLFIIATLILLWAFFTICQLLFFVTPKIAEQPSVLRKSSLNHQRNASSTAVANILLDEEVRVQNAFQELIHQNQHPPDCVNGRIITTATPWDIMDGFTLETQYMGRYLMVAMASNRTLVIQDSWTSAYVPTDCQWSTLTMNAANLNNWTCLYQPASNCTTNLLAQAGGGNKLVPSNLPSGYGIKVSARTEFLENTYYGPTRVVEFGEKVVQAKELELTDIIPYWEQLMGRFWIRAQMVHYLWRPSQGLQSEIDQRLPHDLLRSNEKFIAFHVRFSDNRQDLMKFWGRSAQQTRALERFMGIANQIREENPDLDLKTIYLATDSNEKVREARNRHSDSWNIVIQESVKRSRGKAHQYMWFKDQRGTSASAIATDVEVMRRADFLVGSYQSNVFRLSTELNLAHHAGKYLRSKKRFYTVDIEWYEDP